MLLALATFLPGRAGASFTSSTDRVAALQAQRWIPDSAISWSGDNQSGSAGEVGIGDTVAVRSVTAVQDPGTFSALASGYHHTCAIRSSTVGSQPPGTMLCWGRNQGGQLAQGITSSVPQATPLAITPAGTTWRAMAGSEQITCAIQSAPADGSIWCWGYGGEGQLGSGVVSSNVPRRIATTNGVPATWSSLSGDGNRFCAIDTGGGLWCWGRNIQGEVGDGTGGTGTSRSVPVQIQSTATWSSVAAGQLHACAIAQSGTVQGTAVVPGQAFCWGSNDYRQLGTGSTAAYVSAPAPVTGTQTWALLASGSRSTCGIPGPTTPGELWCWGQLGDGGANTPAPLRVGTSAGWTSIDAGGDGTTTFCGVDTGALLCRGGNTQGLAGDGTLFYRTSWGPVGNSSAITWARAEVGRSHSCALTVGARIFCWGSAEFGQTGNGTLWFRSTPRDTGIGTGQWTSLDSEENHTCAIRYTDLFCWGKNTTGQLGLGNQVSHGVPQQVPGAWNRVTVGAEHTCALDLDSQAWCWGRNLSGATLGTASGATLYSPTPVVAGAVSGTGWRSIDTGQNATCGIRSDRTLWCWGAQSTGVLGNGSTNATSNRPTQVAGGGTDWATVQVSSNEHACATKMNGVLYCWGSNNSGQVGTGTAGGNVPTPVVVQKPAAVSGNWTSYAVGDSHTCALDTAGALWCWGRNNDRQFGITGSSTDSATPILAGGSAGGTRWTSVVAGGNSTCAVRTDGGFWCWGHNYRGKLGQGSENATVPAPVLSYSVAPTSARLSKVSLFALR